jgi:hypothetical protein
MNNYEEYVSDINPDLLGEKGKEHYRLLAECSRLFTGQNIVDIGTHQGCSAYVLAHNENNTVYTFDIVDHVTDERVRKRSNIKFVLCDLWNQVAREPWVSLLLASPLIFLDVDPHNGQMELTFYQFLVANKYQGLLVCDDIWYFKEMRDNFWYKIPPQFKYDLTAQGHWSGTGVVVCDDIPLEENKSPLVAILPKKSSNDNWTLVTAYFNLTKYDDLTPEVRPMDYYMANAQSVMACPYNLVIYCDQASLPKLQSLRPSFLAPKTFYVVLDFDQLSFTGHQGYETTTFSTYRQRIIQNRIHKPYQFDPRNNASYYLFCIARNLLLKKTIEANPFKSTHFAWINICIERMGFKNLIHLDEALSANRDKFSTVYIDFIPKSLIENTQEYFSYGRCSMCSGFYTGNSHYMYRVCHEIEAQFLEYLEQGYGHADEQLFSPVYFRCPDLFQHYYGDYSEMITNYCYVYERPEQIVSIFIMSSFNNKFYTGCHDACEFLLRSHQKGTCHLSQENLSLVNYLKQCSLMLRTA